MSRSKPYPMSWQIDNEQAAKDLGHTLGPWTDGAAWGAHAQAQCTDCHRMAFVPVTGGISGAATRERCDYVEGP